MPFIQDNENQIANLKTGKKKNQGTELKKA